MNPYQSLLVRILQIANSNPGIDRTSFYSVKEKLLRRYGQLVGCDFQEVIHECWGPFMGWNDWGDPIRGKCGPNCSSCGGTGVYRRNWFCLERWEWRGRVFHRPSKQLWSNPESPIAISGRIKHKDYGRLTDEARLWLYLLTGEWSLFWSRFRASYSCSWQPFPLLFLQQIVVPVLWKFGRQKCWCGRKFFHWGSGSQICPKCRKANADEEALWESEFEEEFDESREPPF